MLFSMKPSLMKNEVADANEEIKYGRLKRMLRLHFISSFSMAIQ